MKRKTDVRIKTYFSLGEFLLTLTVLFFLSSGQLFVWHANGGFSEITPLSIFYILGYWGFVSTFIRLLIASQLKKKFEKPMWELNKAARQVAEGNFSVFLEPVHTPDKRDYIDAMFEDFNKMVEELASIETLKNDFIANVSHEIKTPLSIIQNYATALQKENLSLEQQKEYTDTILSASRKLMGLVTNILKLNKLENQGIQPAFKSYDVCRQLCECAFSFENLMEEKNIRFEARIEDRAIVYADEDMMETVWNNLLSNALKFTDKGGFIQLKQTSDAEFITVSIRDSGCGMNDETITHIFDKFYQSDLSRSQEGNGLGLTLSLKVLDLTGGNISVKSTPGEGSTFTVQLKKA